MRDAWPELASSWFVLQLNAARRMNALGERDAQTAHDGGVPNLAVMEPHADLKATLSQLNAVGRFRTRDVSVITHCRRDGDGLPEDESIQGRRRSGSTTHKRMILMATVSIFRQKRAALAGSGSPQTRLNE